MEDKVFLRLFECCSLFFSIVTYAANILFYERIGKQAVIYRVSTDQNDFGWLEHGLSLNKPIET